ncbi:glycosyltransferase [Lucifera butyrica]|nr:hypothetical protein [Lucifera butyrica]
MPDIPYPPVNGGRLDYYYQLVLLHYLGAQVHVIYCYNNVQDINIGADELSKLCKDNYSFSRNKDIFHAVHPTIPYYALSNKPSSKEINRLHDFIINYCIDIDILIIEQPHVFEIAKLVIKWLNKKTTIIYRMQNIEHLFFQDLFKTTAWTNPRKYLYLLEMFRMAKYERKVIERADKIVCVSQKETSYVKKINPQAKVSWLPVMYRPNEDRIITLSKDEMIEFNLLKERLANKKIVLFTSSFVGGFNVQATRWFINEVFPLIQERLPNVIFMFGGFYADKYFSNIMNDSLYVFSKVKSVKPYIAIADLNVILTTSEAGAKLKLMEAIFYYKKTVSTPEGVYGSGLEDCVPNTNDPTIFAEYCIEILNGNMEFSAVWKKYDELYNTENIKNKVKQLLLSRD